MSTCSRPLSGWSDGNHEQQRVGGEGGGAHAGRGTPGHAGVAVGEDRVDVAGGELREAVGRLEVRERQDEVGMRGPQARERVGYEMLRGAGKRPDAQRAELTGGLADGERADLGVGEEPLGALEEDGSRGGGCDAPCAADEQFTAQLDLELRDVLGDRGRGVSERFGRGGERAQTRGLDERPQPEQIHVRRLNTCFGLDKRSLG